MATCGSSRLQLCSSMSSKDEIGGLFLVQGFHFTIFFSSYRKEILHLRVNTIALDGDLQ